MTAHASWWRRATPFAAVGVAWAIVACSEQERPPPLPEPVRDAGVAPADAEPRDATADTSVDVSVDASVDAAEAATPPECPSGHAWSEVPTTPWVTSVVRFGGVSADETTLAWTVTGDAGETIIEVATRSADAGRNGTFDAPVAVPSDLASIAADRVALDPSGNSLVAVAADRSTLVAFDRTATSWELEPSAQFVNLAAMAMDTSSAYYEPVLGGDGSLYYVLGSAGGLSLYQSTWDASQRRWAPGVVLTTSITGEVLTSADPGHLRRATGVSTDGRTLFFYDGVLDHERAVFRDRPDPMVPFSAVDELPMFPEAVPAARCDRLYFVVAASVFTAQ
jgi:hypothetical protein